MGLCRAEGIQKVKPPAAPVGGVSVLSTLDQNPGSVNDDLLTQLQNGLDLTPGTPDILGAPRALLEDRFDVLATGATDTCPIASAQPLWWLKPKNMPDASAYRRTLLCGVNLHTAFGGWWDWSALAPPENKTIPRHLARHGAGWLGEVLEEAELTPSSTLTPPPVWMNVSTEIPDQVAQVLAFTAGDVAFLALQWSDAASAAQDKDAVFSLINTLSSGPTGGLLSATIPRLALEVYQDTTLPPAVRWRALEQARRLLMPTTGVKTWKEDLRTTWLLDSLRLSLPQGRESANAPAPPAPTQGVLLGRWPALVFSQTEGSFFKVASLDRSRWKELSTELATPPQNPAPVLGRAILNSLGAQKIHDSEAAFLTYPTYEATFSSHFGPFYGHLWVFERQNDAVVALILAADPELVGKNSPTLPLVKALELGSEPPP